MLSTVTIPLYSTALLPLRSSHLVREVGVRVRYKQEERRLRAQLQERIRERHVVKEKVGELKERVGRIEEECGNNPERRWENLGKGWEG